MIAASVTTHPFIDELDLEAPLPAYFEGWKIRIFNQSVHGALGDDEVVRDLFHREELALLFFFIHR